MGGKDSYPQGFSFQLPLSHCHLLSRKIFLHLGLDNELLVVVVSSSRILSVLSSPKRAGGVKGSLLICGEGLNESLGKTRLKFEMKSYQEMVVIPLKQMSEDNQQLTYLKNRVIKQKEISKALKDTVVAVTQKLRETNEDNRIVRLRTKMQHEESKEMMDYQERFFEDQIEKIHKHTEEKEKEYEKLLQTERAKAKLADSNSGNSEDGMFRKRMIENFIENQVKDVEAFEGEREELIRAHTEKKVALRRKHLAEEVELEKEFDTELTRLMEKYVPSSFQNSASNS